MTQFEKGDVVNLMAGGPAMTIEYIDGSIAHVVWFTYDARTETWNGPFRNTFELDTLDTRTTGFTSSPTRLRQHPAF